MISILIPVYNYDVVNLVSEMHQQASQLSIPFEIRVLDDHSNALELEKNNRKVESLEHVQYDRSLQNAGRAATRKKLAEDAVYEWLLFLDADVFPASAEFLARYVENRENAALVFGGVCYDNHKPRGKELRWIYGMKREEKTVQERAKTPYLSVLSGVLFIKKALFQKANDFLENRYGIDVLFTANLKELQPKVLHIDNPVIHKGLETNMAFIKKTKKAMESIAFFANSGQISDDYRGIQQMALRLKKYGLTRSFLKYTGHYESEILKNLNSRKPSLLLFDLYRLRILVKNLKNND